MFGAGRPRSNVMLVGEQPGDQEDRAGEPFVGPAGKILDRVLDEAGIDRADAYVTNAVKHFKWKAGRGKRRLHQKPDAAEVRACRPWLETELTVVRPKLLVGQTLDLGFEPGACRLTLAVGCPQVELVAGQDLDGAAGHRHRRDRS